MLSSDWKKIHAKKRDNFLISSFILAKLAGKWQLLILLFQKGKGENTEKIGRNLEPGHKAIPFSV